MNYQNDFIVESEHIYLGDKFKGKVDEKCLMKSIEFLNNVIYENDCTRYVHFEDKTFCVMTYPLLGTKYSKIIDPCVLTIFHNDNTEEDVIELLYFRSKLTVGKLDEYLDESIKSIILSEMCNVSSPIGIRSITDIGRLLASYDNFHSIHIGKYEFILTPFQTNGKQVISHSYFNARDEVKIWVEVYDDL